MRLDDALKRAVALGCQGPAPFTVLGGTRRRSRTADGLTRWCALWLASERTLWAVELWLLGGRSRTLQRELTAAELAERPPDVPCSLGTIK